MVAQNARIKQIAHLTTFPDADKAEYVMQKLAFMAAYVMQKFEFKLKRLVEFYPEKENGGLLMGRNTNYEQIEIRLRSERDHTLFLPREVIMDTLLHELSHMQSMDHDQKFWNTYCDLWKAYSAHAAYYPERFSFRWPSNQVRLAAYNKQIENAQGQAEVKRHKDQPPQGRHKDRPIPIDIQHLNISPKRAPKKHRQDRRRQHGRKAEHRNCLDEPHGTKDKQDRRNAIDVIERPAAKDMCPKCGLKQRGEIWYICDGCGCLAP